MSDSHDSIKYPWFLLLCDKENPFENIVIKYKMRVTLLIFDSIKYIIFLKLYNEKILHILRIAHDTDLEF